MNYSDTERVETYLDALGFEKTDQDEEADLVMFNTCSIKQKAEDKVYGRLGDVAKLRRHRPNLMIAVTGCMVRKSSSRLSDKKDKIFNSSKDVDICLRIEELPKLANLVREVQPEIEIQEIKEESLEDYFKINASHSTTQKTQAFIPVSTGCDKFCTYCIVPFSRGREKSRTVEEILSEAESLVSEGVKEITLIGQTVNTYGHSVSDKRENRFSHLNSGSEPFVHLLKELDKLHEKGLERVRFTSPHPREMTDQLIDVMANLKTQMPYLHLPVQAGDNKVLKRMNRRYTVEMFVDIVKKLREKIPDISISTDIIVGFCGETDEEYENTYNFFKEMNFEHAYISQYSERKGTFAANHIEDNVPAETKHKRWHRLNDLLRENSAQAHNSFKNKIVNVLVESQEGNKCVGRTEHFKTTHFTSGKQLVGKIVPVKITNPKEWILEGEMA